MFTFFYFISLFCQIQLDSSWAGKTHPVPTFLENMKPAMGDF